MALAFDRQASTRAVQPEAGDPLYLGLRLALGLVAGVVLAELVAADDSGTLTRPVLALLGGYSADVVRRALDRLLEAVDQIVGGSPAASARRDGSMSTGEIPAAPVEHQTIDLEAAEPAEGPAPQSDPAATDRTAGSTASDPAPAVAGDTNGKPATR